VWAPPPGGTPFRTEADEEESIVRGVVMAHVVAIETVPSIDGPARCVGLPRTPSSTLFDAYLSVVDAANASVSSHRSAMNVRRRRSPNCR